ncbi:hypothetical protein [Micromonospora pattaloongensis]|uniref:hypothetical protein n=1 Tax=Micromonospora pattaloongensis TaxID=405436 RepID=UPI000B89D719|nr:hypothetical protein [Micromonospora pattaloongensis]
MPTLPEPPVPAPPSPPAGRSPDIAFPQHGAGPESTPAPAVAAARPPVTPPAGTGVPAPVPLDEHKRRWQLLIGSLGALMLLAVCGLSSFLIVADERKGREARAAGAKAAPTAVPRDISSRAADTAPLSAQEVFPTREIVIKANEAPYRVLKTQATRNCKAATSGEISDLLAELGCSQVVRGTLRSPNGGYLVTTGVFNLEDVAGAEWAHEKIKPLVDAEKGRFQGMVAGAGTDAVALSSAQVGWHVRGHYLVYCVVARADGKPVADADPFARQILFDMIEVHLRGNVLGKRATAPAPAAATAAAAR